MKLSYFLIIIFISLCHTSALAADELNYNIVRLQATADRQIDNDVMVVIMSATSESDTAREASEKVNVDMKWAMAQIKSSPDIKSQSLNYQTRPLYRNRSIVGWSVSQQIRLESSETEILSNLVGTLQDRLKVSSMQFEVSSARKVQIVNELIKTALENFRSKAELISTTLGAGDYRIVDIAINENQPPAPYRRGFQAEALSASASAAPQVEAGESEIKVRADGTIQLVF